MRIDAAKLMEDIRFACVEIFTFTASVDLNAYRTDAMRRAAVERKFEIIGEACNRLKTVDQGLFNRLSNAQEIVSFRNRLIHGYDSVDDAIVWDVIQTKLPLLLEEVERCRTKHD